MRNVCFGLKILCVHHWNSRRIMARAGLWHPVIHFLEVSMVQISLQIARSPSSITHIMYLKCLLHNLCSINVCFKGCDTTSAHYFPGLCSFSAVCLSPDQDISLSVSSDFNCISDDDDDEPGTICTHPTRISSSFCKCVWTCWSSHACIVTKPKRVLVLLLLWICCRLKEPQLMCWMQYRVRCLRSGASESCRAAKCEVSCISWMLELGCSVPSGRDGRGGALEPVPASANKEAGKRKYNLHNWWF